MENKKDSFIFYRSFFEALGDLPNENQLEIYQAISNFSLNFKEPELSGISKTIFTLIRPQLAANKTKYENGCLGGKHGHKGGRPKKEKTPKKPLKNPNLTPNDNVNDNVNKNNNKKEKEEAQEKMLADEKLKALERSKLVKTQNQLFENFWINYTPIKTLDGKVTPRGSRQTAFVSYRKAIAKHTPEVISSGLERYLKHCQANSILTCGATVFLNQERFLNDETVVIKATKQSKSSGATQVFQNTMRNAQNVINRHKQKNNETNN